MIRTRDLFIKEVEILNDNFTFEISLSFVDGEFLISQDEDIMFFFFDNYNPKKEDYKKLYEISDEIYSYLRKFLNKNLNEFDFENVISELEKIVFKD